MKQIKAIIFDLDNTLLDRDKTFRRFSELLVDKCFSDLSMSEKNRYIEIIRVLDNDGYKKKSEMFAELLEMLVWKQKPPLSELMDFYNVHYVESAVLMDHALDLLDYCKLNKFKLGLITNGMNHIQYGKVDRLGIREYFHVIVVSEEAGVKKPDERIFRMALERLGLRPDEAVFVGDHPRNDVWGAGQAGMEAIWVERNQKWDESLGVTPIKTIRRLDELISFFEDEKV